MVQFLLSVSGFVSVTDVCADDDYFSLNLTMQTVARTKHAFTKCI